MTPVPSLDPLEREYRTEGAHDRLASTIPAVDAPLTGPHAAMVFSFAPPALTDSS